MTRALAIVLLALSAAACTPMAWVRQDATPEQVDEDLVACRQAAWREASLTHSWYRPLQLPYAVTDAQGRRILVWPDTRSYDPFNDRFMEESRLAQFCMHSKGYELVPVEKEPEATKK